MRTYFSKELKRKVTIPQPEVFFVDNAYQFEIGEIIVSEEMEEGVVIERINRDTLRINWL